LLVLKNAIFSIFFEGGSLPPGCFLIGLPQKIGKIHDHGATPDVQIPGLLHDLLVDDGSVGPHDNAPLLGIDLCIQQGIPDKINDPPLGVLLIHGKLLAERIQINLVTNPTSLPPGCFLIGLPQIPDLSAGLLSLDVYLVVFPGSFSSLISFLHFSNCIISLLPWLLLLLHYLFPWVLLLLLY